MSIRISPPGAAALALAATCLVPSAGHAQDPTGARPLTVQESEAYEMSLELAFACSPYRHRRAAGSESMVQRDTGSLAGTAVFFRSIEGTYLVLEQYDDDLDGHCLVLGWFGGSLEPGSYTISQLAMGTVETELDAGSHSFFGMSAVRMPEENSIFVARSGTLELETVESARITGRFELAGFLVDGAGTARTGDAAWVGSFTAVVGAD